MARFPIWDAWLRDIKGLGPIGAGWLLCELDMERAETPSKIWQFSGYNPGNVRGKKKVKDADGNFIIVETDTMVRGDKLTSGFVAPFNKRFRMALTGVIAAGFLKSQNEYCMRYYYPYKHRLETSDRMVLEIPGRGQKPVLVKWRDARKGHRNLAAMRYMMKHFIVDLWREWRQIEGLSVPAPRGVEPVTERCAA